MSTFPRKLKAALLLALALLLTGIAWYYRTQRQHLRQEVNSNLEAIAQLKVSRIVEWRTARLGEATVMMSSRFYGPLAARWMKETPAEEDVKSVLFGLRATEQLYQFHDALFVNASGKIYFQLNSQSGALNEESLQALATAFRTRKPAFTDLCATTADSNPYVDLVVPYLIGNEPSGAIVLRFDAEQFLYPIIRYWPISSDSGETLLVRRDGNEVLYLSELRHRKNTAFKFRIPLTDKEVPAVGAVLGQRGEFEGLDYRGVKVLAAIKAVPDTSWIMIAKEDEAEAFSVLRRESLLILAMLLFLIASVSTVLGIIWQRNEKAHYQAMFEAEASHRKSEERYRITLDNIMEGCQIVDFGWRFIFLNATAIKYSRRTKEDLLNHTVMELYPGIESTNVFAAYQRCMNERTPELVEADLDLPDGTRRWHEFSIQPIPEGIFVLSTDITDRKRAEEENARLASAIAQSGEAVVIIDDKRIVQWVNPVFEVTTGKKREEAIGQPLPITEAQDEAFYREFWNTLESGKTWRGHLRNHKNDGTPYTEEATVSPVFDSTGSIVSYVSVARDITGVLKLQQEKEKLQEQFLQSQKMESVGRLAGGVAHDFNNMLSVILGHAQLSLDMLDSKQPIYAHLQEINKAALRSAELTRQLLAFARKQTVSPKVLSLNNTIGGLLSMLQRIIGEDVDLAWMPGLALWPVSIDPAQVDQILANLAVNARDAISQQGRITIETQNAVIDENYCATHLDSAAGEYVMLAVSDNGCGMGKEVLSHIFEPFFTTKEVGKGTGLGLATVYGIVKQNRGFINIYSEPGKGSTFKIYFPRYAGPETVEKEEARPAVLARGVETILLVEDEPAVLNLAKIMLERQGYCVIAATKPSEAIHLAHDHSGDIHLLLVDVVMPEMTGRELADRLISSRPGLRRLFMSGYTANVIAHQGVLEPGVIFLQKPFSARALAEKVREALGK
jgi:two-component system, cell cycle sensor histidine kinase and response regulator CckA